MKTFTLDEAQLLLPVLESLLKRAIEGKKFAEEKEAKLHDLRQRTEIEKLVQQAKDAVAEIDAIGVQVKDLDTGLLDFPCMMENEIVLLCWKMGESRIDYWHTVDAGFRGRQPLDARFIKDRPPKPN
jgi:hypothetical protein